MGKTRQMIKTIMDAFFNSTKVGDNDITRHKILESAQRVDPSIQEGGTSGRIISNIRDEYLDQTGTGKHGSHIYTRKK